MGLGPRIVFLIDRYHGENNEISSNKIIANINLSCMRILSYYKHSYCAKGVKSSSISWGYKFFNSSKHQGSYHYKRYQFFEYATCNFDKFENELYEYDVQSHKRTLLPQQKINPGEKLKVALTEIITDFQWDQPELFSPGKLWKGAAAGGSNEIDQNYLFLFTSCPSVFHDRSSYFDECYEDHESFLKCMFPEGLSKKFIKSLKIKLCWVDTGSYISTHHFDGDNNDHTMIENGLRAINGCFVEMVYLSSWWVYTRKNDNIYTNIYNDMLNVSSLVGGLLNNAHDDANINISKYTLSDGSDTGATISLSSILSEATVKNTAELHSIRICEIVDLKFLSVNMLNSKAGYFYVVNPTLSESNTKLFVNLHETYLSEKVVKIEFIPPNSSEVCSAFMVPYTLFCGTIILFSDQIICNSDGVVPMKSCEEDELDDITKEMESELHRCLSNRKQDFGSSLANLIDSWFLSNPKLGFPIEIKNILYSLCDDRITMKKKREDNSKSLVEYMKEMYSKVKPSSKSNKNKENIPLGKLRLIEYRRQLREEKSDGNLNGNINVILKEEDSVSSINVELDVEVQSKDNLNDCILVEYEAMLKMAELSPEKIGNFLNIIMQFYKSKDAESYKESSFSFLNSVLLHNVEDIRDKNVDTPKEELVKEYLLQVQLYLECMYQLSPPNTESILNTVVSFLRTVSFEKSTAFVSKHLNEKVLPRFQDMTDFLHEVYDNLMLDFPEDLDQSKDTYDDDSVSVKSVGSSSVISEHSSPLSVQPGKRTIKRLPSIVGDNVQKKVIAVQVKKPNTKNKGKTKSSSESSDKVVKRTLFSQEPPTSNVLATPKPRRRYSESVLKKRVPDTPETKQISDMIWKKLERKRRHSCIDRNMMTIEESPLKELREIASPIKRQSSFYRSSSFNCHTSPRRFYTIQRHPSMLVGSHGFSKVLSRDELKPNLTQNASETIVSASPMEVKLRRRSTLFSNFDSEEMECQDENQVVPPFGNESEESASKSALRRNIFDIESTPVKEKPDNFSFKLFGVEDQDHKRRKLSTDETVETTDKNDKFNRTKSDMSSVIENLDVDRPVFMTETTVDWLTEIEKDQSEKNLLDQSKTPTNFHDAFAMLSDTPPLSKQSPAIVKAGNVSIKVSPCLSASSIECLENAPIISPAIKRKVSRRRGRFLNL